MGIFSQTKSNKVQTQEAITMVETYFQNRGLNPQEHQLNDEMGTGYWLLEGSAKIYIFVQNSSSENGAILRITAPIVYIPENNREQFYRKLLDLNGTLSNCALSTHDNIALVVVQRPTYGLVQEELDDIVWHVAYVADLLDNKLAEEFGCTMYKG
jgi:hypothetical protein